MKTTNPIQIIGPGILIAATGVGAGDLATAAFSGSKLGLAILWVVLLGAFFKFVLNEGLTRWQLVTGTTIIEGALTRMHAVFQYLFMVYFLVWSFMVAAALMSACGAGLQAILPFFKDPVTGKIVYGILQSLVGLFIIWRGGYRIFEKIMALCIAVMVVTVVITAIQLAPDWLLVLKGLTIPRIPELQVAGLPWVIALMGGIGGTLTILCYGYWIREEGRFQTDELKTCRIDLVSGYIMTALFGLAMVIIGSTIQVEGSGSTLIIRLADRLEESIGPAWSWVFLIGAWSAMFSSLLGVWQSVPYLFTDMISLIKDKTVSPGRKINTQSKEYRYFLISLSSLPIIGLWVGFAKMQKLYAITGALFIPLLALTLLILNSKHQGMTKEYHNRPITSAVLVIILGFFIYAGWLTLDKIFLS